MCLVDFARRAVRCLLDVSGSVRSPSEDVHHLRRSFAQVSRVRLREAAEGLRQHPRAGPLAHARRVRSALALLILNNALLILLT